MDEAIVLYGGKLLPSCYEEWITPQRERLHQEFMETLERLIWLAEDQRDYAEAIHHAQRLLQHDPLHEGTYRRLMRLYMVDGNRASALRTYHTCAVLLQRELGVEPGSEIQQAYAQLLEMEIPAVLRTRPPHSMPGVLPLAGRQPEWQTLRRAWQKAMLGSTLFLLNQRRGRDWEDTVGGGIAHLGRATRHCHSQDAGLCRRTAFGLCSGHRVVAEQTITDISDFPGRRSAD